jgi:hypothetical protein
MALVAACSAASQLPHKLLLVSGADSWACWRALVAMNPGATIITWDGTKTPRVEAGTGGGVGATGDGVKVGKGGKGMEK